MKTTAKQIEALQLISDNPNGVIAFNRTQKDFLRINGNTENQLHKAGLIDAMKIGVSTYQGHEFDLCVWVLTHGGRAALNEAKGGQGGASGLSEALTKLITGRQS